MLVWYYSLLIAVVVVGVDIIWDILIVLSRVVESLIFPKKDQRALGTSLRPERASLDQVRARLKLHKDKQEVKKDEGVFYYLLLYFSFFVSQQALNSGIILNVVVVRFLVVLTIGVIIGVILYFVVSL